MDDADARTRLCDACERWIPVVPGLENVMVAHVCLREYVPRYGWYRTPLGPSLGDGRRIQSDITARYVAEVWEDDRLWAPVARCGGCGVDAGTDHMIGCRYECPACLTSDLPCTYCREGD